MSSLALNRENSLEDLFRAVLKIELNATANLVFKPSECVELLTALGLRMLTVAQDNWAAAYNVSGVAVPFKVEVPGLSKLVQRPFQCKKPRFIW